MKENDIKKTYWVVYTDVLAFLKKHLILMDSIDDTITEPDDGKVTSDAFWDTVVNEYSRIYGKYGGMTFVVKELNNALEEIEGVYKKTKIEKGKC